MILIEIELCYFHDASLAPCPPGPCQLPFLTPDHSSKSFVDNIFFCDYYYYKHIYAYAYMYKYIHAFIYMHTHACTCTRHTHMQRHTHTCTNIHTCIHLYIHAYKHTHMHTHACTTHTKKGSETEENPGLIHRISLSWGPCCKTIIKG